eukprot:CAMPEP_0171297082 /NCGR_PEP_ID=MMETSP0816-20121228/5850_1 /TAXON_ID=420281 /ORGANISM="Proboscia inermis, Strain CCAP1064/1" /LENGTH=134 /DNA_ID=CAMNT_0011771093 /DNA_START=294 /DNA_END=696 /DNA_ORIENTATION=+
MTQNSSPEEPPALEAVATIGTIAVKGQISQRTQKVIERSIQKKERERYLIGGVCSVLDAFHYPTVTNTNTNKESVGGDMVTPAEAEKYSDPKHNYPAVNIGNALQTCLLPKIEALITKDSFETANGADRAAKKL